MPATLNLQFDEASPLATTLLGEPCVSPTANVRLVAWSSAPTVAASLPVSVGVAQLLPKRGLADGLHLLAKFVNRRPISLLIS